MKLHETYIAFYKPSIIIGAFKGSGIYPVRRSAISNDKLKPSHTFNDTEEVHETGVSTVTRVDEKEDSTAASKAFQLYSDTIGTPSDKGMSGDWRKVGVLKGYLLALQCTRN